MNILMDFRKYDGVIGGVEQGVIQITKYFTGKNHSVVLLPKSSRRTEIEEIFHDTPNLKITPLPVPSHVMSLRNVYIDSKTIQDLAAKEKVDLIHFPYNWSFPFRKRVPCLITIHDVIPLTFREAMGLWQNRLIYKPGMRLACRLNDKISTVSEFSKRDIAAKIGVSLDKICVIHNGLREIKEPRESVKSDLRKRFGLENGYILYAGGVHERKNVIGLIQAFRRLIDGSNFAGKLLITGSVSGSAYKEKMKRLCDQAVLEMHLQDRVVFTGFVTDEELDNLMADAQFFVYPSFYEGFGIPVLEAMRVGTPVITSNVTAMPEVGGEAALLVDPHDREDIVQAMARLLSDKALCQELATKGKARAKAYTWANTGEQYLALYQSIVQESKRMDS